MNRKTDENPNERKIIHYVNIIIDTRTTIFLWKNVKSLVLFLALLFFYNFVFVNTTSTILTFKVWYLMAIDLMKIWFFFINQKQDYNKYSIHTNVTYSYNFSEEKNCISNCFFFYCIVYICTWLKVFENKFVGFSMNVTCYFRPTDCTQLSRQPTTRPKGYITYTMVLFVHAILSTILMVISKSAIKNFNSGKENHLWMAMQNNNFLFYFKIYLFRC